MKNFSVTSRRYFRFKKNQGSSFIFIVIIAAIGATILAGLATFISIAVQKQPEGQSSRAGFSGGRGGDILVPLVSGAHRRRKNGSTEAGVLGKRPGHRGWDESYETDLDDPEGGALARYELDVEAPKC